MSLMMVFSPATISAVERISSAVSSWLVVFGTGDSKSPCTSCFIRLAQACMGTLILLESFRATTMEAAMEAIITRILRNIPT